MSLDQQTEPKVACMEAIVAFSNNQVIGLGNSLPWKLRNDLIRFKKITMGHYLLMGRKTFESIGKPLPGRTTLVLSRNAGLQIPGVQVVASVEQAVRIVPESSKLFLVGGAEIYQLAWNLCSKLHLTRVLCNCDGDAFLPEFSLSGFRCIDMMPTPADELNDWPSRYELWSYSPRSC